MSIFTGDVCSTGNFPALSDDLVNSYHLLLCCIDWFYANALMSNRRDLLNPEFSGGQLGCSLFTFVTPRQAFMQQKMFTRQIFK